MRTHFRTTYKLFAIIAMLCLGSVSGFAKESRNASAISFEEGPLTYTVVSDIDKTVKVTSFQENYSEEVLDIPETVWHFETYTVTEISKVIFSQSSSFKVLNIPASVQNIEISHDHWGTYNMEEINIAESNENYASVDGILYNKDLSVLLLCPIALVKKFAIPETVTTIGPYAFSDIKNLESLILPDNIITIEEYAFAGSSFRKIKLPESLECIKECAFNSSDIENLYIPDSVTQIGNFICISCESLTEVRLPENGQIQELMCPVSYCRSLKSFKIPDGVKLLTSWFNFQSCYSLNSIYIPSSFIDFGNLPFGACYSLVNFIVDENNPVFTSEGPMLLSKDKTELLAFPSASGEIEIHEGIEVIGNAAFSYCTISQLTLPASITDIEGFAFNSCHDLKNIIMLSPVPPSLSSTAFTGEGTGSVGTYYPPHNIFVPKEYLQAYKNTGWESKYSFLHIYSLDWLAGVENVDAVESDTFTVYSLDGRLVLKDTPRADVDKLPGGLYIINGKKVFLHR